MSKQPKRKKIRADFRKNRETRSRQRDLTRGYQQNDMEYEELRSRERVSGKGELTRKRTIVTEQPAGSDDTAEFSLAIDQAKCLAGRILCVRGLVSTVQLENGDIYQCATRRLLKTMHTDQRHVVAAGDRVLIRPAGEREGIIERIEPRHGILSRTSRGRQHVIVANVDQLLIIASAAQPDLKPHLIDRMLVSAEQAGIRPVICINKIDLIDPAQLQPLVGVYGQLGYQVLLLSATKGTHIQPLRQTIAGKQNALAGQSGVGKSSLLNALQPGLNLRVREVSAENEKGRHTTTTAELIPLAVGGFMVDTPGIRQFQLWDVIPEEVAAYFRDLRPYVSRCRFPDCTHTHESDCAVKDAVADGHVDARRYESYCHLCAGETS